MERTSLRSAAAVALALAFGAATAAPARADLQWRNGVPAQSTIYNPCLGITEAGAAAQAGYQSDAAATRAGDVFYGHALFAAATHVGGSCGNTDQAAELDLVLPPGVALAVDAQHPIDCFFQTDAGQPVQTNPTCPTHTVPGAYGPQLPAGDGGAAWNLPPGETLEVQFPLVSNRELKGPASGHCPETLNEIAGSPQRDCLLLAVHILDGTDDPWLLPDEQMVIAPAAGGGGPTPPPGPTVPPGPADPPAHVSPTLHAARTVRLRTLLARGLALTLRVPTADATAKLTVKLGARTLGTLTRRHVAAGRLTVHMRLSRAGRARLRHVKRARLTVVEKLSSPAMTLRTTVLAKR